MQDRCRTVQGGSRTSTRHVPATPGMTSWGIARSPCREGPSARCHHVPFSGFRTGRFPLVWPLFCCGDGSFQSTLPCPSCHTGLAFFVKICFLQSVQRGLGQSVRKSIREFGQTAPLSEPEGSIGRRVQRRVSRGMSGPVQCPVHDSAHFCTAHRNSVQTSGAADGHGLPVSLCLPPSPAPSALPFQKPCTTGSFCRTPGRSFCPLISCKRQYAGRTDKRVHLPQKPRNESFPGCRKSLPVQDPSKREADVQPQDMLNQNDFHAFSSFYPETEGLCFLTEAQRFTNQAP